MSHVNSGWRCLLCDPPCIKCRDCGKFIEPQDMGAECPGGHRVETAEEVWAAIQERKRSAAP